MNKLVPNLAVVCEHEGIEGCGSVLCVNLIRHDFLLSLSHLML